jgi:hypothetical protein
MATKGFRANESEYLRSLLDHGYVYDKHPTYDFGLMIRFQYNDGYLLFVSDDNNTFRICNNNNGDDHSIETIEFSYDRDDSEIKIFLEANYIELNVIVEGCPGIWSLVLGEFELETPWCRDAGIITLDGDGEPEFVCDDLLYMFNNVESYVNKVKGVAKQMSAESDEFSKDRFIELMTAKSCKSARK